MCKTYCYHLCYFHFICKHGMARISSSNQISDIKFINVKTVALLRHIYTAYPKSRTWNPRPGTLKIQTGVNWLYIFVKVIAKSTENKLQIIIMIIIITIIIIIITIIIKIQPETQDHVPIS